MKDIHSYTRYYSLLDLTFDSDFDTCKHAYKKSVGLWHPDKFNNNPSAQLSAEEKLKEINVAYSDITEYYHTNNIMPGIELIALSNKDKESFDVSSLYKNLNSKSVKNKHRVKKYSIIAISVITIAFIYSSQTNYHIKNTENQAPNYSENSLKKRTNTQKSYNFSIGSSIDDVIKSQGLPDLTNANIWYYGDSWISFKNGVVSDWNNSNASPLKIHLESNNIYQHDKNLPDYFEKGDSKSDVIAIQGEPIRKSRDIWYYQISKIYFKNKKVISWFNSPLDPLRVKK